MSLEDLHLEQKSLWDLIRHHEEIGSPNDITYALVDELHSVQRRIRQLEDDSYWEQHPGLRLEIWDMLLNDKGVAWQYHTWLSTGLIRVHLFDPPFKSLEISLQQARKWRENWLQK